jgi:transposase
VQSATCTFQHLCLRTVWYGAAKIKIPERWQAVGMHNGGFSHRRVADHFRVNHSIIVRLMQRFRQTGNVTDRPRAGRPRKTTPREDRLISKRAWQRPFSTAGALRGNLAFGGHISTRTVIRRLHHQGMRAQRPMKRLQLTLRHRHARFDWSHDHLGWTIRTTAFGGGGVTVWGCFSFDCKLDLYVLDGNLTGQIYRDNVLAPRVVPHFDNHALAERPMCMDDNARLHRTRIVQHFLQQGAAHTIPWPAM